MTTYITLQKRAKKQIKALASAYDLAYDLVDNLISYAKCLPKRNTADIDEAIFTAQMADQFGLTSRTLVNCMFEANKSAANPHMTIDEFCRVICIFLTNNLDLKVQFVFNVYDLNRDGCLNNHELYLLLKPCVLSDDSVEEKEESVRELIDMVLKITDLDLNSTIEFGEFRRLVHKDILYLQYLGPCLPSDAETSRFLQKFRGKTPLEVRAMFQNERYKSLGGSPPPSDLGLYPFPLELP